jgi:hypothetical protein
MSFADFAVAASFQLAVFPPGKFSTCRHVDQAAMRRGGASQEAQGAWPSAHRLFRWL